MTKMNIEVGEYVRTEIGTIGKVIRINELYFTIENNRGEIDVLYEGNQKHSKNIIDLIEVGDYVNGEKIQFINRGNLTTEGGYDLLKKYKEISTIVTKEQFRNIEYKAKNR